MAMKRKIFDAKSERNSKRYFANREKFRYYHIQYKYGISKEDYEKLLQDQNFACALCLKHTSELSYPLNVDHCHKTDEVRGLLCSRCNTGLSCLGDNVESLERALDYLKGEV